MAGVPSSRHRIGHRSGCENCAAGSPDHRLPGRRTADVTATHPAWIRNRRSHGPPKCCCCVTSFGASPREPIVPDKLVGVGKHCRRNERRNTGPGYCAVRHRVQRKYRGSSVRTVDDTAGWARSSFCESASCLEVSVIRSAVVGVRDSKDMSDGPVLRFTPASWGAFVHAIRNDNLAPHIRN